MGTGGAEGIHVYSYEYPLLSAKKKLIRSCNARPTARSLLSLVASFGRSPIPTSPARALAAQAQRPARATPAPAHRVTGRCPALSRSAPPVLADVAGRPSDCIAPTPPRPGARRPPAAPRTASLRRRPALALAVCR